LRRFRYRAPRKIPVLTEGNPISSLVLTDVHDTTLVRSCHTRLRDRLVAWLCTWRLDSELAGGACPDASPALSLRASRLIGPRTQRKLAAEIREVLSETKRRPHRLKGARVSALSMERSSPALEALANRLSREGPVDSVGIARVRLLLRDGTGPLYNDLVTETLETSLQAAMDSIDPRL
jgi:hypothetical protein